MLTTNNRNISELPNNLNIFNDKIQLVTDKCTAEISIAGTDETIKAYLKISASGNQFVIPHADAAIEILAGSRTVIIPFSGLTPGCFVELHIYKQAATTGTISATLI